MKSKLAITSAALLGAALLLWAPAGSGDVLPSSAEKAHKVWVQDNFFDRRSVQVREDDRVVWVWRGVNRHNVRFTRVPKGVVRGGSKTQADGRWRRTFRAPGTYRYICKLYTGMRGTVTVKERPASN